MEATVFISYRKAESAGWARLLYERLAAELGRDNVFLDQVSLEPGTKWLADIRERSTTCSALLALIGPHWAETMRKRYEAGEDDVAREEIEAALRRDSGVEEVIPVLVEDATIPSKDDLRYLGSLQPLLNRQQAELRPSRWDADVAVLVERLKRERDGPVEREEEPPRPRPAAREGEAARSAAPPPERAHYDELIRLLLDEGSVVVPFLGPDANLPDYDELAAYLAHKLDAASAPGDLAKVSQSISVAMGPGDLYMALRRALPSRNPPGAVHRFLAGFPAAVHGLGLPESHQLIVTSNYDDALERAFEEAEEPFDVAVYMARGSDKGRFVHVPHDGEPLVVADPNGYAGFPIDAFGRVERSVILKIHGAVDRSGGPYSWRDNYVITEDDYIDYMSVGKIESIVPQQLLAKLRDYSHFLFLGYTMRDWNLRVFLIRIFGDGRPPNTSWAIQAEPDRLDERFWQRIGVDLAAISLDEYARELEENLKRVADADEARA